MALSPTTGSDRRFPGVGRPSGATPGDERPKAPVGPRKLLRLRPTQCRAASFHRQSCIDHIGINSDPFWDTLVPGGPDVLREGPPDTAPVMTPASGGGLLARPT